MTIGLVHPPHSRKNSLLHPGDRRASASSFYRCFQNYYHGHRFLNPNPHYIPNVRLSINHWQIRDLVQIDQTTGSVFHTVDENIRVLSMKQHNIHGAIRSRNHLTLPYRPRCFHHAAGGLVVAGGVTTTSAKVYSMNLPNLTLDFHEKPCRRQAKGLFSIFSPGMGQEMSFQLGDMINNAVTIYPQQNSTAAYTSYVCNNDSSLYIVDVSDGGIRGNRRVVCDASTSLNNVHQASDGSRHVTVTGDSGAVFILDPSAPQPVAKTIETGHDSGFGISYHHNGHVFATAFQDGTCSMYDLRHTSKPLHEVKSTRPGHSSGAFRTCRFLNSPVQDLLVVSEHLGRVHLVDVRDFSEDNHQVIVFPFALDQFARYKNPMVQQEDDFETDVHSAVAVYSDEAAHFTAPLVYDYEYLTEVNPKLFKGFTYEPQYSVQEENVQDDISQGNLGNAGGDFGECGPDESGISAGNGAEVRHVENAPSDEEAHRSYLRQSQESYQQSVNHINGEMEIAGLDWYDNQLYVGCEDGGLLVWDVNVRARRSFGSFSYV